MGIEALSRGAKRATFLERDPRCLRIIEQNLQTCGISAEPHTRCFSAAQKSTVKAYLLRRDAVKGISYLQKQAAVFRVIYFDPPYSTAPEGSTELYATCLALLSEKALLSREGTLLVEHAKRSIMPDQIAGLTRNRIANYSDTVVSFYRRNEI